MIKKIVFNRIKPVNEIEFIRKNKVWIKYDNIILGIRYSMRDLCSDLNNYAWPANQRYVSGTVNNVSASSGISLLKQLALASYEFYV